MCGQAGIIFGNKERSKRVYTDLRRKFAKLLLLNEERGAKATGIASMDWDGSSELYKEPLPATDFIPMRGTGEILSTIGDHTSILMGHTRYPTGGTIYRNRNNHPIRAGNVFGTHNGSVWNADRIFRSRQLKRFAEVDSEVLFRLAGHCTYQARIEADALAKGLNRCKGSITSIMISRTEPGRRVVVKRSTPLHFRKSKRHNVLVYSSDPEHLESVIPATRYWKHWHVADCRVVSIDHNLNVRSIAMLKEQHSRGYHSADRYRKPVSKSTMAVTGLAEYAARENRDWWNRDRRPLRRLRAVSG